MTPTARALATAVALGSLGVALVAEPSAGQIDLPIPTTTTSPSSTTTTPSSSSTLPDPVTTTTAAPPDVTTTSAPARPRGPRTRPLVEPSVPELELPPGDGAPDVDEIDGPRSIPGWAVEKIQSVTRSGGNGTARLLERLEILEAFGFTPEEIALVGLGRFPVRGEARFGDDWWYPRYTPEFHLHEGTDIFADFGTPVTAPFDGVVTMGRGAVGGLYTYLTLPDGTYYYFAHLDELPKLPDDDLLGDDDAGRYTSRAGDRAGAYRVKAGDVIGTVGDTGNAEGGSPHLHFEFHPADEGGEPVNPKPFLDEWLEEAEEALEEVVELYTTGGPRAVVSTQRTRAEGDGQFTAPSRPLGAEILGVSSVGPGTGVQVVTEELVRTVSRIDWDARRAAVGRPLRDVGRALAGALGG